MTDFRLKKSERYTGTKGPLLLTILDGVGLYKGREEGYPGNAVDIADTPNFDALLKERLFIGMKAHGTAVGLPSDGDMGNSEVGHNAMGAGRIFDQGAKLVNKAIETGRLFDGSVWKEAMSHAVKGGTVHFMGLLSDGNVHSHQDQLEALIGRCDEEGVEKVRVHAILDGRDVDERSAEKYVDRLERFLDKFRDKGRDYQIASGGGRMVITMDRYEADWNQVARGWKTHVAGEGDKFPDALTAIEKLREKYPQKIDQDLPPFVIEDGSGNPVGPIKDGDAVIFYNFRGDRAIEISRAFTEEGFDKFERKPNPTVFYAGMMEYDGDLHIPPNFLVEPPEIERTVSEYLAKNKVPQYAISETQKYGHVTYFWNGNNSEKFDDRYEEWVKIPSDVVPFEEKPKMKAMEITDAVIKAMEEGKYKFYRLNFPNGDMVGHTGILDAAVTAMDTVDKCLARLRATVEKLGGTMIVMADHGNCEQMIEVNKKTGEPKKINGKFAAKTSHTLNPVPFAVIGADVEKFDLADVKEPGLGNLAATILFLLGFEPPEDYLPSLLVLAER